MINLNGKSDVVQDILDRRQLPEDGIGKLVFQLSQMFNVGSVGWSGVVILLFDDLLDYL